MALTQQDYKNIYSMLPTEKNAQGDSTLGLGKTVTNLIPPFDEWIDDKEGCAYFFMPPLDGLYVHQFFPKNRVEVTRISKIKQTTSISYTLPETLSEKTEESYWIKHQIGDIIYNKLLFNFTNAPYNSNSKDLTITLRNDNGDVVKIGYFAFTHRASNDWYWNGTYVSEGSQGWMIRLENVLAIYGEEDIKSGYQKMTFLKKFFETVEDHYEYSISNQAFKQISLEESVWVVKNPGGYLNTKNWFYYKQEHPCNLHLCLFESNFPWIVDFNNTIVGADFQDISYT